MKILDVMVDLETLDKYNSPVIMQIAAVPFNIETGEVFPEEFDQFIDPMSGVKAGLEIGGETVSWWLTQDKDAVQKVIVRALTEGKDLKETLFSFNKYLTDLKTKYGVKEIRLYGNGTLSDIKWLESAYLKVNLAPAWSYKEPSCVRALIDCGKRYFDINPKETIPFTGVKHNAIDDCKHQIEYCCAIVKTMQDAKKALDSTSKK